MPRRATENTLVAHRRKYEGNNRDVGFSAATGSFFAGPRHAVSLPRDYQLNFYFIYQLCHSEAHGDATQCDRALRNSSRIMAGITASTLR